MSDADDNVFLQAMEGVQPIKAEARARLVKKAGVDPSLEARRRAATAQNTEPNGLPSGDFVKPVDPLDILEFKRPGVQHGVYKNLRLGKYSIDAQLDLHQMTVEQARVAVAEFVADCLQHNIRCALINHGKGLNRKPQPALLKSCVAHWLPQLDAVMAFHSAQRHHGGVGATYVLLKKSEKKSLENRERHMKRG